MIVDNAVIQELCRIYEKSELPVKIVHSSGSFENSAFKEMFQGRAKARDELISRVIYKTGKCYEVVNGNVVYVNVIRTDGLKIFELLKEEPLEAAFHHPSIARYLTCFFSKLRTDVLSIYDNSQEIRSNISVDSACEVEAAFKTISDNLNDIIGYIIDPEQIFSLLDDSCAVSTFCVNDVITDLARQLTESGGVETVKSFKGKCYATVNRNAFRVVVADIVEEFCKASSVFPKCVEFSAYRNGSETHIRIEAKYVKDSHILENSKSFPDTYLSDYVRKLFCERFDSRISYENEHTAEIIVPEVFANRVRVEAKICFEEAELVFSEMKVRGTNLLNGSNLN